MQVELIRKGKVLPSAPAVIDGLAQVVVRAPKKGAYKIRLRNDGPYRCLAVVSVDGINVMRRDEDGHGATYDGPGYVLSSGETLEIPGWRRDNTEAAAFTFEGSGDSYAEQVGRGNAHVGLVGVAVFHERQPVPPPSPTLYGSPQGMMSCDTPKTMSRDILKSATKGSTKGMAGRSPLRSKGDSSAQQPARGPSLGAPQVGTGYGKRTEFRTKTTTFKRASETPDEVIMRRYISKKQWKELGLRPQNQPSAPDAFPGEHPAVPAPPGWNG